MGPEASWTSREKKAKGNIKQTKKQKSSIGSLYEGGKFIATYIQIAEMLNNHFDILFISEILNNVPDFTLSYRKKDRGSNDIFQNK